MSVLISSALPLWALPLGALQMGALPLGVLSQEALTPEALPLGALLLGVLLVSAHPPLLCYFQPGCPTPLGVLLLLVGIWSAGLKVLPQGALLALSLGALPLRALPLEALALGALPFVLSVVLVRFFPRRFPLWISAVRRSLSPLAVCDTRNNGTGSAPPLASAIIMFPAESTCRLRRR